MALYIHQPEDKSKEPIFICTNDDSQPYCADCTRMGEYLCDYPIKKNKTCDRIVCDEHSHEIEKNHHFCDAHFKRHYKQAKNQIFKTQVLGKNDC